MAAAGGEWGICGVSERSRAAVEQLAPQDGLYSVLQRHPEGTQAHMIGAIRELIFAQAEIRFPTPTRLHADAAQRGVHHLTA